MRALVIDGLESSRFQEIDDVRPGPGELLLDVRHVSLCGSDLSTFKGLNPLAAMPCIPGHEIGAEIICTGADVPSDYAPGKRVIVVPYTACGTCTSCRKGRPNACRYNQTLGVQRQGALTERIAVPYQKVILNDTLAPRHLALVEPLAVGFHAAARGRVTADDTVLVLGCGMIGLGIIASAAHRGARVIAVDLGETKLAVARRYGASVTIDAATQDVAKEIDALTAGDGVDVVVEAVGTPATFVQAIDLVGYAGRVVYVGYSKAPVSYETRFFNLKELDIMGSRGSTVADFQAVIAYFESRAEPPDDLISKVFPFDAADQALPYWVAERDRVIKVMIER
jgi:2-desacetyl-2-hydroxyethyl bacteriochlorophyllide A dehydrogenase